MINILLSRLQSVNGIVLVAAFILLFWWESARPFYPFFRDDVSARLLHAGRNIVISWLNVMVMGIVFSGIVFWASISAEIHQIGLLYFFDLPRAVHALAAIVLLDLWMYWWHRLNHRIPFLWRFHRMHHADLALDVTTARRFHIGEITFATALKVPLVFLLGIQMWEILLYEVIMQVVVQFHHANIYLPESVDRYLRLLIPTPAMHRVHHSRYRPETDSNYTALLSVWDRVFGSFRLNKDPRTIKIGLDEFIDEEHHTLAGMLKTPFVKRKTVERKN